jgi:hypothetical protein
MKKRMPYGILFGLPRPALHTKCQIIYTHWTYYVDAVYRKVYRMAEKVVDCCKGTRKTSHHAPHTFHYMAASSIYSTTPHNLPYPHQQMLDRIYDPMQHTTHIIQSIRHYLLRTPYCPCSNPQYLLPSDVLVGIQHLHNKSNLYI